MIAVDSNILLRYAIQDDPEQLALARDLVDGQPTETPAFVSREVTAELVWVLRRVYRLPRRLIADAVERLMTVATLRFEATEDMIACLERYRDGSADFADLMILAAARRAGCSTLYTFDRKLAREDDAMLLEAP